ncbi:hypothetical protein GCM10009827_118980 [Dactylosporangium maewongense]|uniref:ParB/Sulfiredoxin domain-containing protein n=1 Tax=Dactylosporangium maewongense TaxID=634393 RepID=A0ABN2DGX9_9ACTN
MTGDPHGEREVFRFLAWAWDVTAGNALAVDYPVRRADVTVLAGIAQLIGVHQARAAVADLARPLLVAPMPGAGLFMIDGWHRITRALAEGVTHLPAKVLTEADEARIRLRGP